MKKTLLIIVALFFGTYLFADTWVDMTLDQAEKAVAHIKENPYIFDYCDCCDGESVSLVYVEEVYYFEVEEFSDVYQVQATGRIIHTFEFAVFDDEFAILDSFLPALPYGEEGGATDEFDDVLSANYTFVFKNYSEGDVNSASLASITGYDYDLTSCVPFMQYLYPDTEDYEVDEGYEEWYHKKTK